MTALRVAVLGAGPVGLEAAAAALQAGHRVRVFEAREPAAHLDDWGHVRLFTPFGMNAGPAGRRLLGDRGPGSDPLPPEDRPLTGRELREAYLLPLAEAVARDASLETGRRVVSVSRGRHLKHEAIGGRARARDPFRLLLERRPSVGAPGEAMPGEAMPAEEEAEADAVLDCTGTWGRPNWLGPGGAPARGERGLDGRIARGLPDPAAADRARFAGRRTLLVGGGHSAATTALALAELAAREPHTSVTWITRTPDAAPVPRIPADPLPERARLAERANALAVDPPAGFRRLAGARIVALAPAEGDRIAAEWESSVAPGSGSGSADGRGGVGDPGADRDAFDETAARGAGDAAAGRDAFDEVVANVGHEPDDGLYRQLQVHECYATRGPMKLSAALLGAAGDGPADCLAVGGFGPDALRTPEPGFFILGVKSYGRNPTFLLRAGYEQVADVVGLLEER